MSILTKSEIIKCIKRGKIKVEPLIMDNIGPGSIDLTLDNKFRVFLPRKKPFDVQNSADYNEITKIIEVKDKYILKPKETVLGITREKVTLPDDICGWLEGRSKFARLGLMVHISASFMQPGISNRQVLEIFNASPVPLAIHPGTKICQFIFESTKGKARYYGQFMNQENP
jgi:dCTP deaminase